MPSNDVTIPNAYAGMPDIAHGGYLAGLLTAALDAKSTRVRLHRPVPSARRLRLARPAPAQVELHDSDALLAEGVAAEWSLEIPEPVAPEDALSASRRFPGHAHHPFPGCVCCGPENPAGLGVFPGPVSGRGVVAAHWVPPARHADERGHVPDALVSAALDCPQLWALMIHAPAATAERVVTAVLETRLERPVVAGEPHVVMAWPLGREGRRWVAGAAIFGPGGELCAAGRQTAAVVGGWGVPLGRDHWAGPALAVA